MALTWLNAASPQMTEELHTFAGNSVSRET